MMFGPEHSEQFRNPDVNRRQAVKAGVNVKEAGLSATGAAEVIAGEHDFPVATEAISRVPAHAIAAGAQAGDGGDAFAADAEQRLLPQNRFPAGPQDAFPAVGQG
jgi:hypothetical protein